MYFAEYSFKKNAYMLTIPTQKIITHNPFHTCILKEMRWMWK